MSVAKAVGMETKLDVWNAALTTGGIYGCGIRILIQSETTLAGNDVIEIDKFQVLY